MAEALSPADPKDPAAVPLLAVRGLTLHREERCLLQPLDWNVAEGERWAVLGRNGSGKTTLLRALAGLPSARVGGQRWWQGRLVGEVGPVEAARLRGWMPAQPQDRFALPVRQVLALAAPQEDQGTAARMAAVMQALDLHALSGRPVTQLSSGERQRVALGQLQMQDAPLRLLDEPVAWQDPAHAATIGRWMRAVPGAAWVFSAHDLDWVQRHASHVLLLMGDGSHCAGPRESVLGLDTLAEAFGCEWRALTDDDGQRWYRHA